VPYSADRGKKSMKRQVPDELKLQVRLLEYLQAHQWRQARPVGSGRFLELCPLHPDHQPSLLVDPNKNLFYCYGCRRGGDIVRFVELYHQVNFPQALTLLHQWRGPAPLLPHVVSFYRTQLHRHSEAVAYLSPSQPLATGVVAIRWRFLPLDRAPIGLLNSLPSRHA
jgi:hypothetical protein